MRTYEGNPQIVIQPDSNLTCEVYGLVYGKQVEIELPTPACSECGGTTKLRDGRCANCTGQIGPKLEPDKSVQFGGTEFPPSSGYESGGRRIV
jgi:DnaJ-class molecular chaperone